MIHGRALKDIERQDLGHFDNLLGIRQERVEELREVRQLFHHLRHRCIQNLYHRRIGSLFHDALLILVLWPPRLTQTGWPRTQGEREALPERGRVVLLVPLPRSDSSRCGAYTRTGPWRRSDVRAEGTVSVIAPSDGGHCLCRRLHRCRHPWLTAQRSFRKLHKKATCVKNGLCGSCGGCGADGVHNACVCPYALAACNQF